DEKIVNILLLGTDSADMRENRGRADALLLFSVNVQTGDAKLVSLPETARTALPELPEAMRLKYLNCFGGPMLVMRQINQALGLNITRYCAVNFAGFEAAIDEMGGVWLPLTDRERVAVDIEDGVERLDGRQALRYVKLRWGEAVTDRPRKLLEALLRQVTVQGIDGAFSLMGALLPATDTNLTIANLTDLLFALLGQETPPSFETLALPSQQGMIPQDAAAWCRAVLYGR
ncbi:MAG: LCP family protein, partial [Clostridia bacterium]|nr:LCP family protein [Clostridia bacterium]